MYEILKTLVAMVSPVLSFTAEEVWKYMPKEEGMREIERHGPFRINGAPDIMQAMDALLRAFVQQRRMKIAGEYKPCYVLNG